jgi:hypothetical protein
MEVGRSVVEGWVKRVGRGLLGGGGGEDGGEDRGEDRGEGRGEGVGSSSPSSRMGASSASAATAASMRLLKSKSGLAVVFHDGDIAPERACQESSTP